MARQCYKLNLNGDEYKLRLTMAGQKALLERNPGQNILGVLMSAVDDLQIMEDLLTEALNWEGNSNTIHTGAELYDSLVDAGFCGSADFTKVVLNIAKNAGLLTQDDRDRLERVVGKAFRREMDMLFGMLENNLDSDAAGEPVDLSEPESEGADKDPLEAEPDLQTL